MIDEKIWIYGVKDCENIVIGVLILGLRLYFIINNKMVAVRVSW